MNENTYLSTQEHITCLAFDALARSKGAQSVAEKLEEYQYYQALCEGACRLRIAYAQTRQKMERQHACCTSGN